MRSLVKLTVILAASTFALAAYAPVASADYQVSQCDASQGTGLDGWRIGSDGWYAYNVCASAFYLTGLVNGVYTPAGTVAYWRTPNLPGNLSFQNVTYEGSGSLSPGYIGVARFCMNDVDPWCTSGGSSWVINNPGWVGRSDSAPGAREFQLLMSCFGASPCPNTTWSNVWLRNLNFTMHDADAPGVDIRPWSFNMGLNGASPSGWVSGVQAFGVWGGDGTSGIDHDLIAFDNDMNHPLRQIQQAACNRVAGGYGSFVPCPTTAELGHSVNTGQFSDGTHQMHVFTYDASGNPAQINASWRSDNTEPAEPASVDVAGDNAAGWRTVNDFDLTWSNTGETIENSTQSGIAQACADVKPQPEGGPDPAPQCASGVDALNNVTVPGEDPRGWKTDIYTVDRAGNVSDKREVTLKLDMTTPPRTDGNANGWVNRAELLAGYNQTWVRPQAANTITSGICGYAFSVTKGATDDPGNTINVIGNVTQAPVPANLDEDNFRTHLKAISCAGTPAGEVGHTDLLVDLTDPTLEVTGASANGWTKSLSLAASAADARSGMVGAVVPATIDAGAYIEYVVDGLTAAQHRGASGDLTNDTEGLHTVIVNAYDVAGNKGTKVLSLGVDKTSPFGLFDLQDPSRPTLIQMPVDDPLSGVASARVEVRKIGDSGSWKPLATTISKRGDTTGTAAAGSLNAATVIARFTDTKLPKGTYAVRSVVTDAVGNEFVGTKSANGQDLVLSNPMRRGSLISAGFGGRKLVCGNGKNLRKIKGCKRIRITCAKGKNKGKKRCWKVQRKVVIEGNHPKVTIPYRRSGVVKGIFTRADGTPGPNLSIDVYATPRGGTELLIGRTTTDRDGYYALKVRGGVSRTIRAEYAGTELEEDASAAAQLDVAAAATLRLSRKVVGLRKPVHFTGKVYSDTDAVIPPGGLRVALQAKSGKKWIPVVKTAVRTDTNGKFKFTYKFRKLRTKSRITFRVVVLPDSRWPFATGYSKSRTLTVAP